MLMIFEKRIRWTSRLAGRKFPAVLASLFFTVALGFLAMLPLGSAPVMAQEVISNEEPTPSSTDEVTTPMERTFKEKPPLPRLFPWLKEQLRILRPFFGTRSSISTSGRITFTVTNLTTP